MDRESEPDAKIAYKEDGAKNIPDIGWVDVGMPGARGTGGGAEPQNQHVLCWDA